MNNRQCHRRIFIVLRTVDVNTSTFQANGRAVTLRASARCFVRVLSSLPFHHLLDPVQELGSIGVFVQSINDQARTYHGSCPNRGEDCCVRLQLPEPAAEHHSFMHHRGCSLQQESHHIGRMSDRSQSSCR